MQKIIIRFPNWLGDLVMAQPLILALREIYPEAELTALVKKSLIDLFKQDPHLDRLWSLEESPASKLKQERFDLGILLTNSISSAWHFFRGRVQKRLGYSNDGRSWLLNLKVPFLKKQEHQLLSYQRILQPLNFALSFQAPSLYLAEEEKRAMQEKLEQLGWQKGQKLIVLSPFAAFGKAKCWPLENYGALAQKLIQESSVKVVILGTQDFQPEWEEKSALFPALKKQALNLIGKTSLREMMAVLDLADLLVTNDSGPMHVSAAFKKPLMVFFGSTNPALTGPIYDPLAEVIYRPLSCSPCYRRECSQKIFCLSGISEEEVFHKILDRLKLKEKQSALSTKT